MSTLANLETFVAAIRAGSFAAAGRQLALSPAMVGRRIEALEAEYGARLIERSTRRQRLTEMGEAFLVRAEAVLDAAGELEELTHSEPGKLTGRIRVTGPATLGIHRLAAITARFCATNPEVVVEMSLNDRRADLIAEGFDLAIRIGEPRASSLITRRIGTYTFRVSAAPSYIAAYGAPKHPDELQQHRCILNLNMSPRNRWPFLAPDGTSVVAGVSGGLQIDNGEAQHAAGLAGAGIVYLPEHLVGADIAAGRMIEVLPGWRTMTMPIQLLYPSRRLVPRRLTAYMDAVIDGLRAG